MIRDRLYIGGVWIRSARNATMPVINPAGSAGGDPLGTVPRGVAADARAAVHAARWAFDEGPWPAMSGAQRAAALQRLLAQLHVLRPALEQIAVQESGCPIRHADATLVAPALAEIAWYADHAARDFDMRLPDARAPRSGRQQSGDHAASGALITRDPVGVVAAICAAAEPLASIVQTAIPAIAMGNTVVIKPSTTAPLAAFLIAEAAEAAGLPPGVLNIVTGHARDLAGELCASPMVDLVALNGRAGTARRVAARAGESVKRMVATLGGSATAIVLDGAPLDEVAADLFARWLRHGGQAWGALGRIVASPQTGDQLAAELASLVKALICGDPSDPATEIGPMRSSHAQTHIESLRADALTGGAIVAAEAPAGSAHDGWPRPVVLTGVGRGARVMREEVSGPLLAIASARDDEEAIRIANNAEGVAAVIWAGSRDAAYAVARRVRAATVIVNGARDHPSAPVGGYAGNGLGRLRGLAGMEAFTEPKTIITPG